MSEQSMALREAQGVAAGIEALEALNALISNGGLESVEAITEAVEGVEDEQEKAQLLEALDSIGGAAELEDYNYCPINLDLDGALEITYMVKGSGITLDMTEATVLRTFGGIWLDMTEATVLRTFGGPNIWVTTTGDEWLTVNAYWGSDEATVKVHAPQYAEELWNAAESMLQQAGLDHD